MRGRALAERGVAAAVGVRQAAEPLTPSLSLWERGLFGVRRIGGWGLRRADQARQLWVPLPGAVSVTWAALSLSDQPSAV